MDNKIYFKCPNCGAIKEVKELFYNAGTQLALVCFCEDGSGYIEVQAVEDKFTDRLDKLCIPWGYDKFIWKEYNNGGCRCRYYDGEMFIYYNITRYFDNVYTAFLGGEVREFNTLEQAKQACEDDLKNRKNSNE